MALTTRREFLAATAGATSAALLHATPSWAAELPADVTITRVVGFSVPTRRNKVAGKNSRRDVHGDRSSDPLLRIYTNAGVDGFGFCRAAKGEARQLLGQSVASLFDARHLKMNGPLGRHTMPLWDVAGKLTDKPIYELLGGKGTERVAVYDGSIYLADLLPQYGRNWRDQFKQEIDMGRALGHTAFKIKIGRGYRWMDREEGDRRDIEVVRLIRDHGGPDVTIGIDANNGYDLEGAKRLMEEIGDCDIAFSEELFDETIDECLAYKEHLRSLDLNTLLADGETQHDVEAFRPFVETGAIDVLQGDMNGFGIEAILAEADLDPTKTVQVAPHNWGSLIGFYHQLQVGRGIENFYMAEHDPLTSDLLVADGFKIEDGHVTVPKLPGSGLAINEAAFEKVGVKYDLRS